jgi:murein DD-endopeptidase MepM/ murein hydrolase activator NlpD
VRKGEPVAAGQEVGACGNSGNFTQPHVHIQLMDSADPYTAHGVSFRDYRVWSPRGSVTVVSHGIPHESEVVEPLPTTNHER